MWLMASLPWTARVEHVHHCREFCCTALVSLLLNLGCTLESLVTFFLKQKKKSKFNTHTWGIHIGMKIPKTVKHIRHFGQRRKEGEWGLRFKKRESEIYK